MILKLKRRVRQNGTGGAIEVDIGHDSQEYVTAAITSSKERLSFINLSMLRTVTDTRELIAQYLDGWDKAVADRVREIEFTFEDVNDASMPQPTKNKVKQQIIDLLHTLAPMEQVDIIDELHGFFP